MKIQGLSRSLATVCKIMVGEVFFGALGTHRGTQHLAGGHLEVGDETLSAMTDIIEGPPFDLAGYRG